MTKYYSRSKQKFVDIEQMPDQYVRNAFVKMCKHEPTEDVIFAQQQKERADKYKKLAEDNFISGVDDLGKIDSLEKYILTQKKERDGAVDAISNSFEIILKENEKLKNRQYNSHDKDGRINLYYKEYAKLAKERDKWKEKSMNMIEKSTHEDKLKETISTYNTYLANAMPLESFKKINNQCEELQLENVRLVAQLEHDEHNVGKLDDTVSKDTYQVMWDNCQVLQNERAKLLKENNELKDQMQTLLDRNAVLSRMYNNSLSTLGDVKMFSEIPNTVEGAKLILEMKKYLNRDSYKIRVRGQYLDEETKKTEGWRKYERGQPIEKSKCLRVYVDVKKDVD